MALTKVSRGLLSTGIVDNSNATAITLNADESATFSGALTANGGIDVTGLATASEMTVSDTDDIRLRFLNGTTFKAGLQVATSTGDMISGSAVDDLAIRSQANMLFSAGGNTEAMRISGGNVLVGKTTTALANEGVVFEKGGAAEFTTDAARVMRLNRTSSDGSVLEINKDGSTVGIMGSRSGNLFTTYTSNGYGLSGTATNKGIIPVFNGLSADNVVDLGNGGVRYDDIYATNGTINTSDRNQKQDIEALTDAEQRVAVAAKGLLRKFRWIDAVEAKGDDARIHFGIIAQDLQAAFESEGLDAARYAMFISSTWTDEETDEERTRLGVRYSELLAFIIAAI